MAAREAPRQDLESVQAQLETISNREISSMTVAGQAIKTSIEEDHRRQAVAQQEKISNLESQCAKLTSECNSLKLQIQKAKKTSDKFKEAWKRINIGYNAMRRRKEELELRLSQELSTPRLFLAFGGMAVAVPAQQTPPPQIEE